MNQESLRSWGWVELFRAQHGDLPSSDDKRDVNPVVALRKAAEMTLAGVVSTMNAASMMVVAAELIERNCPDMYGPSTEDMSIAVHNRTVDEKKAEKRDRKLARQMERMRRDEEA